MRERLKPAQNEWSGWGTALKPAHEPCVLARKPISEKNIADNCIKHGTGALNIDATRVGDELFDTSKNIRDNNDFYAGEFGNKTTGEIVQGRFPANVIHDGSDEVVSMFPDTTSVKRSSSNNKTKPDSSDHPFTPAETQYGDHNTYADSGSAARFFYSPKVSRKERNIGFDLEQIPTNSYQKDKEAKGGSGFQGMKVLDDRKKHEFSDDYVAPRPSGVLYGKSSPFQELQTHHELDENGKKMIYCPKVSRKERNIGCEDIDPKPLFDNPTGAMGANMGSKSTPSNNNHPTVKPIELMKYLIKLVTKPGGRVLDPFNGSGSTGCAAVEMDYEYVGIDLDPHYVAISERRIAAHYEATHQPINVLFKEEE
jgi:hypothetical protein